MTMYRLTNPIRHYAWGSRTHIAQLCGLDLGDQPAAEMWIGAHPADPSLARPPGGPDSDGQRLDELIAGDPRQHLGADVCSAFNDRLPYLMKLLAARDTLSLQVHPPGERARRRYAEQQAAGMPLTAFERTYQDASHKPELLFALTRFEGMAGFRDTARSAAVLRGLSLGWLDEVADMIEDTRTPFQTLREVVTRWLAIQPDEAAGRLDELRTACVRAAAAAHEQPPARRAPARPTHDVTRESLRVYAAVPPLIDGYPEDPSVLVTLLLNHVVLAPGEAMFIDAGVIHAHTAGFGIEMMAASDNVLRAGLTPKHVDIPELLETTSFNPIPPPHWAPSASSDADDVLLAPPVDEFELHVLRLGGPDVRLEHSAPRVVLCLAGTVRVTRHAESLALQQGESVFVSCCQGPVRVGGAGRAAVAQTPASLAPGKSR